MPTAYRITPAMATAGRHHRVWVPTSRTPHPHLLDPGLACSPSLAHQPWCQRQRTSLRWIRAKRAWTTTEHNTRPMSLQQHKSNGALVSGELEHAFDTDFFSVQFPGRPKLLHRISQPFNHAPIRETALSFANPPAQRRRVNPVASSRQRTRFAVALLDRSSRRHVLAIGGSLCRGPRELFVASCQGGPGTPQLPGCPWNQPGT